MSAADEIALMPGPLQPFKNSTGAGGPEPGGCQHSGPRVDASRQAGPRQTSPQPTCLQIPFDLNRVTNPSSAGMTQPRFSARTVSSFCLPVGSLGRLWFVN